VGLTAPLKEGLRDDGIIFGKGCFGERVISMKNKHGNERRDDQ
jgi:hypothetical protein